MSGDTWHDHVDATWNPRGVEMICGMMEESGGKFPPL